MINFFYKNNIKIKDIASGIKFNIALAGKNNLKKLNSFKQKMVMFILGGQEFMDNREMEKAKVEKNLL